MRWCDGCHKLFRKNEGFLFYSDYCPIPGVMGKLGLLLLCDSCTSLIINREAWGGLFFRVPPFGGGSSDILHFDENISKGIIKNCKLHHFSPRKAKNKARKLAIDFWSDMQKGEKEALDFWKSDKRCFIATACYGSSDSFEVNAFCYFRDEKLKASRRGQLLISLYYLMSPSLARIVQKNKLFRKFVRIIILKPIFKRIIHINQY